MQAGQRQGRRRYVAIALAAWGAPAFAACGSDKSAPTKATETPPSYLGAACGPVQPVVPNEVDYMVMSPDCSGEGACLRGADFAAGAESSAGTCTCRCDGAADAGPFCTCGDGFECREEVRDLGVGDASAAGSYCVPKP